MSDQLLKMRADMIAAMKAKDRTRKDGLSLLINEVNVIAKAENREATNDDVIQALNRSIKKATEVREILVTRGESTEVPDYEIALAREYLPAQMSEDDLEALIISILGDTVRDKKAQGLVMKTLNSEHKGKFDNKVAGDILKRILN